MTSEGPPREESNWLLTLNTLCGCQKTVVVRAEEPPEEYSVPVAEGRRRAFRRRRFHTGSLLADYLEAPDAPAPSRWLASPASDKEAEFSVRCRMRARWVPHFLAMLRYMQRLGSVGASRRVSLFSDGDGDFRPRFEWDGSLPSGAEPRRDEGGNREYDAG